MASAPVPGLTLVGGVVVLTGQAARAALDLALIGLRSRRANGLPPSPAYAAIAQAHRPGVAEPTWLLWVLSWVTSRGVPVRSARRTT